MVRFLDKSQISTIASDDIMPITDISESSNDKKVSIGQLATYFSENISDFAQKDLSNTNMLTDAILLAPNGVMITSNSNTNIIAKSGMVLLFADGRNTDGTLKSLRYTLTEDKTQAITTLSNGNYVMFLTNVGVLSYVLQKDVYISRTQPIVTSSTSYWYDIKNNLWKKTVDTGSTWSNIYLNSLGLFTINNGTVTEIIPNTVAYIPNAEALMLKDVSNITEEGKEKLKSYVNIDSKANTSLNNLDSSGQAILNNKANINLNNINTAGENVIKNLISSFIQTGTIIAYGSNNVPSGWLICDGSAVSRTAYADLFSAIGTSFGEGDGSTTFNLPNFTNRALFGSSTVGTVITPTATNTGTESNAHDHNYLAGQAIGFNTGWENQNHTHIYNAGVNGLTSLVIIKY